MATVSKWTPFGVALDITATGGTVTRTSATQFTVVINAAWDTYYSGAQTNYGMSATSGGVTSTISAFDGTKRSSGSKSFTGTYSISGNGSATKTITVTFKNFNTDNGDNASKSVSFTVTVPAWTSYAIKYNANGGTGAPANQTKTYGKALTLSSTIPTRTNYNFKGWGTSASATTVSYAAGASYTANAAITLYAIWEVAYQKPRIVNVSTVRCNSGGTVDDEGQNGLISFDWECDKTVSSIVIKWKLSSATSWSSITVSASGTSGTVSKVVGSNALSTENTYDVHITVSDSGGSSYATSSVTSMKFVVDILNGGGGIAFGKTAELENVAEFAFEAKFNSPVYGKALGMDRLPAIPSGSDFNNYIDPGCYAVQSNAVASACSNIPIARAGRLEVWAATGEGVRSEQWSYLRQRYIPYNSANAVWERDVARGEDNVWTYYEWYRSTLSLDQSKLVYHGQTLLWEGTMYMTAGHTANLSEAVSAQPNGIVLVFSKYADGAALENNFNSFFVPKKFIVDHKGYGNAFTMMDTNFGQICHKYLYINDTYITGHANNNVSGTGTSGIAYANNKYVLRYVYGV